MKKIVLLSTVALLVLTSCRQSDVLSNDDATNLQLIQSKRDIRNSELKTNTITNSKTILYNTNSTESVDIVDHEPPKIPPKR